MTRRERDRRITGMATPRSAQSIGSSRKRNICRKLEFFRCWKFHPAANRLSLAVAMCKRFCQYGSRRVGAKTITNGPLTEAAVMTFNPGVGNRDWTFFGLVLQRQITDRVLLDGEIYHRTATISGSGLIPHLIWARSLISAATTICSFRQVSPSLVRQNFRYMSATN
jgi:hypothetical protein